MDGTTKAAPGRVSPWQPLANRTFRWLWLAQLGSNIGSWMQSVGGQWYLVEQHSSPAVIAWVQAAGMLPTLLLALPAGVLADSMNRRRLLLIASAFACAVAAALYLLGVLNLLTPLLMLALTFLLGTAAAMSGPAWQAVQAELVPREQIAAAASLGGVTVNAARAVGPALAGVIVAAAGPNPVFALNALSFLGLFAVLLAWRRPPDADREPERFMPALVAGLRYTRAAPTVRRILLRSALFVVPAAALWALLPAVASSTLGLSAGGYGMLLGVLGLGAIVGVLVMPWLQAHRASSVLLAASALGFALASFALVTAPLAVVLPTLLVAGICWIVTLTTLNAALQLTLAGWVRARGMAVYLLVFIGGQGLAAFAWGALAASLGLHATMLLAAALLVLGALSLRWWPLAANTGMLDRSIVALCTGAPTLVFDPAPDDGPVVVEILYTVPEARAADFVAAMAAVERSRRRTGASRWQLTRSGERANLYREAFTAPSWGEYVRSGSERWTGSDRQQLDAARALADGDPVQSHFFPLPVSMAARA